MDGITLTISASVASAIIGAIAAYWRTKQTGKVEVVKQPIDINIADKFATREQLSKFEERLNSFATKDEINALRCEMYTVREQLKTNDERDESRIRGVHKRIDELMKIMIKRNTES
jgi:D-mannonate dehydratase